MAVSPWEELTKRRQASYSFRHLYGNTLLNQQRRGKRRYIQEANIRYMDALRTEVVNGQQPLRLAT